ncbi:MAG: biotin--[acetyl-CoA-carboxylase] ligase [Chitinophagaceae bacterium]
MPTGSFIELQSTDSTNNYALAQIHAGLAQNLDAYFALEQTAGRGQRGKLWTSEPGKNIQLSLVLKQPALPLANQFIMSAAVASAVHHFLSAYAGEDCRIKWPNDIYWNDRKAGGILIENMIKGQDWQWCVVGVGININQTEFPPELPNPVSLKQITGKDFSTTDLAKQLYHQLVMQLEDLGNHQQKILDDYRSHFYKINETVRLKKGNRIFEATIKSVTAEGKLVIEHGIEEELETGQVEWFF